jgi:tetratricopeptide (TPR) repeat protein
MITALCTSHPDSLSIEELLYGATLTNDINTKVQIYQAAEKQYASDWRASNNLGVALLMQNKVAEAGDAFSRSEKNAAGNPIVMNNLGIIQAKKGNRTAAMELYNKANGAGSEVNYNKGILQVRDAKYSDAVSSFGSYNGFNKALAQLLSGTPDAVNATIDGSNEKGMALSYYLKAVAAARKNNNSEVLMNLKTAVEMDGTLKAAAKDDAEFVKLRADAGFTSLVN